MKRILVGGLACIGGLVVLLVVILGLGLGGLRPTRDGTGEDYP
jgi:hypothetical protein